MTFEEAKKKSVSCVYCMEFPNGKKYVGKTKDLGDRMRLYERFDGSGNKSLASAISDFGLDSISIRILFSLSGCLLEDKELCLSLIEIKYIRELGTTDSEKGYNVSFGGELLGIPVEYLTTDKDSIKEFYKPNKVVLEYDLDGKFVREHESIAYCAYVMGVDEENIRGALKRNTPFRGFCYLREKRYGIIPETIAVSKPIVRHKTKVVTETIYKERVVTKTRIENPCIVYDASGAFCGEYPSLHAGALALGLGTNLSMGQYRCGYIAYKKTSDEYPMVIESRDEVYGYILGKEYRPKEQLEMSPRMAENGTMRVRSKHRKLNVNFPIYQYTLSGEFVAKHASIRDASYDTGISYSLIYNCVKGATKRGAGFRWSIDAPEGLNVE